MNSDANVETPNRTTKSILTHLTGSHRINLKTKRLHHAGTAFLRGLSCHSIWQHSAALQHLHQTDDGGRKEKTLKIIAKGLMI